MAKVKSPLLSLSASGKIANSLVFMRWKGIDDVRQYVIPANPQSTKQVAQRAKLTNAVAEYHATSWNATDITALNLWASTMPSPMSGFNAMVKQHITDAIAGNTWIQLYGISINTATPGTITVTALSPSDATAKLYYGSTKTSMPTEISGTYESGTKTWTFTISGLTAGTTIYFYIKNTASGKAGRTGIYVATAT